VYISVRIGAKRADEKHPFGHHRAEPIASLIVAILTAILGFEIINIAFSRLMTRSTMIIGIVPLLVLLITILVKIAMYIYTIRVGKMVGSTAILASATDHKNDVLVSLAALIGVGGTILGYPFFDSLVAILIGGWIIFVGYKIGAENIKYLMGESPDEELLDIIKQKASSVKEVKGIHDVRAHYVGVLLQIEAHILIDRKISLFRSHQIGKNVQRELESIQDVDKAFIHIDPI